MKKMARLTVFLFVIFLMAGGASVHSQEENFSKEVSNILEKKLELINKLAKEPRIISAVKKFNQENRNLTRDEIFKLDEEWKKAGGVGEFIKSFLVNECSQRLINFQKVNNGFPEIFISDKKGLIIATTNKTSDYYQADEAWWIKAYDAGKGKIYHGEVEYDESAFSESIALYVPVMDSEANKCIGVIKAVCDISFIKMEL